MVAVNHVVATGGNLCDDNRFRNVNRCQIIIFELCGVLRKIPDQYLFARKVVVLDEGGHFGDVEDEYTVWIQLVLVINRTWGEAFS